MYACKLLCLKKNGEGVENAIFKMMWTILSLRMIHNTHFTFSLQQVLFHKSHSAVISIYTAPTQFRVHE